MKTIRFGTGSTIFIIFFGVALVQALLSGSWSKGLFWVLVGTIFLILDNVGKHERT